jgi:hypothetical protein
MQTVDYLLLWVTRNLLKGSDKFPSQYRTVLVPYGDALRRPKKVTMSREYVFSFEQLVWI